MSGFKASSNPYPSLNFESAGPGAALLGMPAKHYEHRRKGLGDITTIGTDLANGDVASVIGDLLPWASSTNLLLYGAGFAAWWFLGRGSEEKKRQERSAALKKAEFEYQLQKEKIDEKYPLKRKSKKKGLLGGIL